VLLFGWSFLEGVGAALILPAIVALVAGNFARERRPQRTLDRRPRARNALPRRGGLDGVDGELVPTGVDPRLEQRAHHEQVVGVRAAGDADPHCFRIWSFA